MVLFICVSGYVDRSLSFVELLSEVLDVICTGKLIGSSLLWPEEATPAAGKWRRSTRGLVRTRWCPRLAPRRPEVSQPWKQVATVAAASSGMASQWRRKARHALKHAWDPCVSAKGAAWPEASSGGLATRGRWCRDGRASGGGSPA
jgi:hypothetical protein